MKAPRLKPPSEFVRSVITLSSGTVVSQVITVSSIPILTRLYTPEDFGVYAVFTSTLAIVGVVSTGRFEYSILAESDAHDAWRSVGLVVLLAGLSGLLVFLLGVILSDWLGHILQAEISSLLAVFAGLSVFLVGAYQAGYYWHNRNKRYRQLAQSRIAGSLLLVVVSGLMGYLGAGGEGLIAGAVAGQMGNLCVVAFHIRRPPSHHARSTLAQVAGHARKHINYPKFLIPSGTLERVSSQSYVIILSALFGPTVAGALGLYQRAVSLPVRLVGNAISDVYKQHASVQLNESGQCRALFTQTAKRLFALALAPFLVLLLAAPPLFAFVFGEQWREAGEFAQTLSWMFLFGFIVSPLSSLFFLARKQKYDLIMQGYLFTATMLSLFSGYRWGDAHLAVALFTLAYCSKYLIEVWLAWRIAGGEL